MNFSTAHQRSERNALLFLSLVSGLGGVVYEVLYMRHLSSILGDMFYVHAGLLGTFLLGNGIGAWIAHRFTRHLFAFELIIGAYAMMLPPLLGIYETSVIGNVFSNPVGQSLFAAALLLAVPSVAIGISIPLFSEYVRAKGEVRDAFKAVYFFYNFGAAISVILVDLFLIRWIGFRASLMVVGLANLSCGAVLLARRRRWTPGARERDERDTVPARVKLALLLASTASAVFLAFYIKACYHLFLPQRENFAICTSISVLSIAVGTLLVRRFRLSFVTLVVWGMLSLVLVSAVYPALAAVFRLTDEMVPKWAAIPTEVTFGLLLSIPYVFLGATIPSLLLREGDVARRSGTLLLISGIGNALGLVGFIVVFHPLLPVFAIPVAICVLLASALAFQREEVFRVRYLFPLGVTAFLLPIVYVQPETAFYLVHDTIPPRAEVVHYKYASDNVSYVWTPRQSWIKFNGMPSIFITGQPQEPASVGHVNRGEIVSGVVPALFAPERESALVLGLGSGMTAGAAALMFDRMDVVEINAAFFPLVDSIKDVNFDVLHNPAANIIHDDARSYLASTDLRYDAIINSVPSPTYFAAGKIYTGDFFDLVKGSLRPGGIYSTWFTPGDMSTEGVHTLFATLADRFEVCNLAVLRKGYYFVTCADRPLERKGGIEFPEPIEESLANVRGVTLDEYFGSIVVSDDVFEHLDFEGVPLNTDDFPILEFQIMRLGRLELSRDPIVTDPARFNVRTESGGDDEAFLNRAIVLAQIHAPLFKRAYGKYLLSRPELAEAFDARMQELFR